MQGGLNYSFAEKAGMKYFLPLHMKWLGQWDLFITEQMCIFSKLYSSIFSGLYHKVIQGRTFSLIYTQTAWKMSLFNVESMKKYSYWLHINGCKQTADCNAISLKPSSRALQILSCRVNNMICTKQNMFCETESYF